MKKRNRVTFFNILSTCLLYGISVFVAPLFSRLLGAGGYGTLSNYNIWVSVLAIAATLQTQGTLVNARVEYPQQEQAAYQSSAMSMSVLVFLVVSGIVLAFLEPISQALQYSKFFILLVLFQAFGTFGVNFMNTKLTYEMKAGRNMLLSVGTSLSTLLLSLVLVLQMPKAYNYYGRIVAIAAVYGFLGLGLCIYILAKGRVFYNSRYWKFCFALAIPYVFYNLADLLLGHIDTVMLYQMQGDAVSEVYSLAYQFGTILFTIFGALNNTWVPFYFEDTKQGRTQAVMQQSRNYLELFTVLSVGFMLLSPEVFTLYGGEAFHRGTGLIPLFVTSHYINFLCTFPVNYEYYHKKVKVVAFATILSSVINAGLNYVLILRMGMLGAAVATVVSHCFQLVLHYVYTRYILGKQEYPFGIGLWGKYGLCFLAVLVLSFLMPDAWLIRWGLGALIGIWELLRIRKRKVLI